MMEKDKEETKTTICNGRVQCRIDILDLQFASRPYIFLGENVEVMLVQNSVEENQILRSRHQHVCPLSQICSST